MFCCENVLKGANRSPRIKDGKIYWYEGDTFLWSMKFVIKKCDGTDYILQPTDKITVEFKILLLFLSFLFFNYCRTLFSKVDY